MSYASYTLNTAMRTDSFAVRHIGPRKGELEQMLNTTGAASLDQLIGETIPDDIRLNSPLELPQAMSESEL